MCHFPPFLGTAPKPEHLKFLIGLEENGPRIHLATWAVVTKWNSILDAIEQLVSSGFVWVVD